MSTKIIGKSGGGIDLLTFEASQLALTFAGRDMGLDLLFAYGPTFQVRNNTGLNVAIDKANYTLVADFTPDTAGGDQGGRQFVFYWLGWYSGNANAVSWPQTKAATFSGAQNAGTKITAAAPNAFMGVVGYALQLFRGDSYAAEGTRYKGSYSIACTLGSMGGYWSDPFVYSPTDLAPRGHGSWFLPINQTVNVVGEYDFTVGPPPED